MGAFEEHRKNSIIADVRVKYLEHKVLSTNEIIKGLNEISVGYDEDALFINKAIARLRYYQYRKVKKHEFTRR